MSGAQEIAEKLTKAQREAVRAWKWKGWVLLRLDTMPLMATDLVDVQRFPMTIHGKRKCRLNETGLAVRRILERQDHADQ